MAKYRKKPILVEAVQWTRDNAEEINAFVPKRVAVWHDGMLELRTREGLMYVCTRDWIIKGVLGEFYACKPDIFEMTYELEEPDDGQDKA